MKNITFTQTFNECAFQNLTLENAYIAYVPIVVDKQDLFTKLSETFVFPYFGWNWNALIDLYCDFWWIENEKITIVHESLSKLPFDDFRVYIEIMLYCIDSWKNDTKRDIHFVFNKNEEENIMSVIHECMQTCLFEYNLKEEDL